jgi:hypothetical protein
MFESRIFKEGKNRGKRPNIVGGGAFFKVQGTRDKVQGTRFKVQEARHKA